MKNRVEEIDFLRGVAIIGMILIHTTYYFISNPRAYFLWNYSQFAVPVFIFCSAYLSESRSKNHELWKKTKQSKLFASLIKRARRLLFPYWIFLFFFSIMLFISNYKPLTINYVLQSFFTIGGVDISWLVLLFLELAILSPFLLYFKQSQKTVYFLYGIMAFASSILLAFWKIPFNYRFIMWLPWSVLFFLPELFARKNKYIILFVVLISLLALIGINQLFQTMHRPTSFIENKYPPNIYILSYGVVSIGILYFASRFVYKGILKRFLYYLSINSYSIYFIHYFILITIDRFLGMKFFNWYTLFLAVFCLTITAQNVATAFIMGKNAES